MINVVIAYDITDDKKRKILIDLLEKYGVRVNYSVFEIIISENNLNKLVKDIQNIIDKKNDNVRCYILDKISAKKSFSITNEKDKPFERKNLFF